MLLQEHKDEVSKLQENSHLLHRHMSIDHWRHQALELRAMRLRNDVDIGNRYYSDI